MSGRCPVHVQYIFGVLPDMYRTYSEEITDKDKRSIEAILGLISVIFWPA
jgi:hypothetical protein